MVFGVWKYLKKYSVLWYRSRAYELAR